MFGTLPLVYFILFIHIFIYLFFQDVCSRSGLTSMHCPILFFFFFSVQPQKSSSFSSWVWHSWNQNMNGTLDSSYGHCFYVCFTVFWVSLLSLRVCFFVFFLLLLFILKMLLWIKYCSFSINICEPTYYKWIYYIP